MKSLLFRQLFDLESSTFTYILADQISREAVIIDSVRDQVDRDLKLIQELRLDLRVILETHIHADHITGASLLKKSTGAKIGLGASSGASGFDFEFRDGDRIPFGSFSLEVMATPGHTDVSYCFLFEDRIFTGDTLLIRGCGRTDFQSGSSEQLYDSVVNRIFRLPAQTLVYPGHDYKGHRVSSIGEEIEFNSRLGGNKTKSEFVEIMRQLKLAHPKKIQEAVPANMRCGDI